MDEEFLWLSRPCYLVINGTEGLEPGFAIFGQGDLELIPFADEPELGAPVREVRMDHVQWPYVDERPS